MQVQMKDVGWKLHMQDKVQMQDLGCRFGMQGSGCRVQDARSGMDRAGCGMRGSDAGHRVQMQVQLQGGRRGMHGAG